MASTFSQVREALNEIPGRTETNRRRFINARNQLQAVIDDLAQMQTDYGVIVADLNNAAAGAPADGVLQDAKAEKDKLVADFIALRNEITAKINAFDAA